jgi:hypothetical protein
MPIHEHIGRVDNDPAKKTWPNLRITAKARQKSHAELKRTSSIGYGTHNPSPARGDGNVKFFGAEAVATPRPVSKRRTGPSR